MAQQVEQFTRNEQVASSNLASSSSSGAKETLLRFFVKKNFAVILAPSLSQKVTLGSTAQL